jgi:very-short-patch-repair endonuclease
VHFYDQKIEALRTPTASERLDPPLIDVYLKYGFKERNKTNPAEADYIVAEVERLIRSGEIGSRTIGIVSLLGAHQAALIDKLLLKRVGEKAILSYKIMAGDASAFQGKERDVMFVSMVSAPNDFRKVASKPYQQRFNVAFSRARDREYLIRSLSLEELDPEDLKAKAIMHFQNPMRGRPSGSDEARDLCESEFETEVYDALVGLQYAITPQVPVGGYRIDLVVEGGADRRLAVELDGEKWHGPDRWWADYKRQVTLERMGWTFWRCWGSHWRLDRTACLADLQSVLESMGIQPGNAPHLSHAYTEHRVLTEPPILSTHRPGLDAGISAEAGDAVEVEFTDEDPSKRVTFLLSLVTHDPNNGVVKIDSPIGRALLGAAVGDDLQLGENGDTVIVLGIFKGRGGDEAPVSNERAYTPTEERPSLH